jgi:hypothetical protein
MVGIELYRDIIVISFIYLWYMCLVLQLFLGCGWRWRRESSRLVVKV